jgi:hypothetical protein
MEIEKRNEIWWSIKRTNGSEKFLLNFTDQENSYKVGIGLERDKSQIIFEMDNKEFQNFYGIISAFKGLVDQANGSPNAIDSFQSQVPPISADLNSNSEFKSVELGNKIALNIQNKNPSVQENPVVSVHIEEQNKLSEEKKIQKEANNETVNNETVNNETINNETDKLSKDSATEIKTALPIKNNENQPLSNVIEDKPNNSTLVIPPIVTTEQNISSLADKKQEIESQQSKSDKKEKANKLNERDWDPW